MTSVHFRAVVGIGTLVLGVLLATRSSGTAIVFGRYSLQYFLLLLGFLPVVTGGLLFWAFGADVRRGFGTLRRSLLLRAILLLVLVPLLLVAVRFVRRGDHLDAIRMCVISGVTLGGALVSLTLASRGAHRALQTLLVATLTILGGTMLAALSITPLFGSFIEQRMGLPAESTLRLTGPVTYGGELHRPGASFVYRGPEGAVPEFAVAVENNSWGFHDRERTGLRADDVLRLVVLGDAYVQGLEVPRDSAFPALLERRLQSEHPGAEVLRLAMRSAGQERELELLRTYGVEAEPDVVVLVWATNDLLDNHPDLAALYAWTPDAVLFPGLLLDRLVTGWLRNRLYLLDERYRLGVLRPDYWAYLEPTPPQVSAAFDRTESLLDEIVAETREMGSRLLIVVKRPTNERRWLARFPGLRSYDIDIDAHARWLAAYAESRGVGFLDLGPPFQTYYNAHPTGHPDQYSWPHAGHLREPGHRLAADLIHDALVRGGFLDDGAGLGETAPQATEGT